MKDSRDNKDNMDRQDMIDAKRLVDLNVMLIDNYDSFTWNLYQYARIAGASVTVRRNDRVTIDEIREMSPTHLLLSPGPGYPAGAGILLDVVRAFAGQIPLLGICLGHQAIGEAFGGKVVHSPAGPVHGKASDIHIAASCPLFRGSPPVIRAGRYHSLVLDRDSLPTVLTVTAETTDGLVMGVMHRYYPVFGVQFHPESVLTPDGQAVINRFLRLRAESPLQPAERTA